VAARLRPAQVIISTQAGFVCVRKCADDVLIHILLALRFRMRLAKNVRVKAIIAFRHQSDAAAIYISRCSFSVLWDQIIDSPSAQGIIRGNAAKNKERRLLPCVFALGYIFEPLSTSFEPAEFGRNSFLLRGAQGVKIPLRARKKLWFRPHILIDAFHGPRSERYTLKKARQWLDFVARHTRHEGSVI
jgi:hypothetical protein